MAFYRINLMGRRGTLNFKVFYNSLYQIYMFLENKQELKKTNSKMLTTLQVVRLGAKLCF